MDGRIEISKYESQIDPAASIKTNLEIVLDLFYTLTRI